MAAPDEQQPAACHIRRSRRERRPPPILALRPGRPRARIERLRQRQRLRARPPRYPHPAPSGTPGSRQRSAPRAAMRSSCWPSCQAGVGLAPSTNGAGERRPAKSCTYDHEQRQEPKAAGRANPAREAGGEETERGADAPRSDRDPGKGGLRPAVRSQPWQRSPATGVQLRQALGHALIKPRFDLSQEGVDYRIAVLGTEFAMRFCSRAKILCRQPRQTHGVRLAPIGLGTFETHRTGRKPSTLALAAGRSYRDRCSVGRLVHEVIPVDYEQASRTGEYSCGGFGGGYPRFHPHAAPAGNLRIKTWKPASSWRRLDRQVPAAPVRCQTQLAA
jgi:hypothetical protein